MNCLHVWSSDWGLIDVTQFNHLKFRKDGWFDGRRNADYYYELKEYIQQKENELSGVAELAWDNAKVEVMPNVKLRGSPASGRVPLERRVRFHSRTLAPVHRLGSRI